MVVGNAFSHCNGSCAFSVWEAIGPVFGKKNLSWGLSCVSESRASSLLLVLVTQPRHGSRTKRLSLLRVLSLPGKRVHRAVAYQGLLYCGLFTLLLLGNVSTCQNILQILSTLPI
jgi:hypothetical protein